MVSSKILWNSVISTKDARFAGSDIKNMYLETPDRYEYMKMPITLFPADIIDHYKLKEKALNGYVYMEIRKVIYGLPQAGILLANKLIKELWLDTDTSNNPTRQAFGNMSVAPSGSTHVWMISESNILDASTFNTYTMRYKRKHTKLLKIWKCPLLRHCPKMELCKTPCRSRYGKVCYETTHKIWSLRTFETATLPVFAESHQV